MSDMWTMSGESDNQQYVFLKLFVISPNVVNNMHIIKTDNFANLLRIIYFDFNRYINHPDYEGTLLICEEETYKLTEEDIIQSIQENFPERLV